MLDNTSALSESTLLISTPSEFGTPTLTMQETPRSVSHDSGLIAAHLEIDVHLTYVVKGKQESWRSVKEVQVIQRTCSSLRSVI